jgi:hypothetical protein
LSLGEIDVAPLDRRRLARAKLAYTTRHVRHECLASLIHGRAPHAGDLVLARVDRPGDRTRLELAHGRQAHLFVGDEIVVCYGDRCATERFEAAVPADLGQCELVAAGGVAGRTTVRHSQIHDPTRITPLGLIGDSDGRVVNLRQWALTPPRRAVARPPTIAILGTSVNAGMTSAAAAIVKGVSNAGLRVGTAKVTGTGAGDDVWMMSDAGADVTLDFTHAGLASTYRAGPHKVVEVFSLLTRHLADRGIDLVLVKLTDGLAQAETVALICCEPFEAGVDGLVLAAHDALGAAAGVGLLQGLDLPVLAVTGAVSESPLSAREARSLTALPVLDPPALRDPANLVELGICNRRAVAA